MYTCALARAVIASVLLMQQLPSTSPPCPLPQLYRVNVILQSADATASQPSRAPFFVLRRFSQFRHLYDQARY